MKTATAAKKGSAPKKGRTLGGESKPEAQTNHGLVRKIQKGLDFAEFDTLRAQLALPMDQLAEKLGIARATLHRRKLAGRLAPDESDKVVRFARLFAQAEKVFGGAEEAREWLSFPQTGLGGALPLDYARTEVGAREVENLLGRIEYGVYS